MINLKYIILTTILFLTCNQSIARSSETRICIENLTREAHVITVADIKSYDWDGDSRPDKNFNNVTINPEEKICQREEINAKTGTNPGRKSYTFTFIVDRTPTQVAMRYTHRIDIPGGFKYQDPKWGVYKTNNQLTLHGYNTIFFNPDDWWVGYDCGEECSTFQIKYY